MSSSSSTSSIESVPPLVPRTYTIFGSSNQTTAIKLDRTNFLIWESILLPLIEGNQLESHIDGSTIVSPKFVPDAAGPKLNPAYTEWFAVDRLLVGWLRNTMAMDIGAQLLHCKTTVELWTGAHTLTCASTKARVMVVKNELHNTLKNSLTMDDYLNKMKSLSDELALASSPLAMDDLILHTLNGLDTEYNAIVVKLVDKPDLSWIEAQATLLAFESRLAQLNHFSTLSIQPYANLAQRDDSFGRDRSRNWRGATRH